MKEIEYSIMIDKPVEDVFAFVEDLERRPEWEPGVVEAKVITGNYNEPGAIIEVTNKVLGKKMIAKAEVIEFVKNERVTCRAERPFYHEITNQYEVVEGKTKFTRRAVADFAKDGGVTKLASSLIIKKLEKAFEKTVQNAKFILEK